MSAQSDAPSPLTDASSPSVAGGPLLLLRLEGAALLAVAATLYARSGQPWGLFALLFLAPDIAFLAYLRGPRFGAVLYNALHTTLAPLLVGAAVWVAGRPDLAALALVWLAHVGFDRMMGYGLKYGSGFGRTHLGGLGPARGRALVP